MDLTEPYFEQIRTKKPLVHLITNYVTVNDCANITLACGGSPIMADEEKEVEEIVSACSCLVLNIGTANDRTLAAILRAGYHANRLGIPVVLDPAGAGASGFRNDAVTLLLKELNFSAIKGNISEIKFLSYGVTSTQGVDASSEDLVCEKNLMDSVRFAQKLSLMTGSVIMITGPIDIVVDSQNAYAIRNGHPMMPMVTGTGCMSAAVAGCFIGAKPASALNAMVMSTTAMGICGELAYQKMKQWDAGTATLRTLIIDEMSKMTDSRLFEYAKIQQIY